jgi:phosphatidylinositol alpha 1,6-mannosyltransferase
MSNGATDAGSEPMKIAYFTESLLPHVDGVSRTLAQLFNTLERRGVDFRVYSPFVPGPEVSWNHRVYPIRYFRFPLYRAYRVSIPFRTRVTGALDVWHPDLVHVVSPTPLARRALRYARTRGIPAVGSFHTHFVSYFRYYGFPFLEGFGWWLLRSFYGRCARVYVPSQPMIEELEAHGIERTVLWSRGIDLGRFSPAHRDPALRAHAGADAGTPLVLMVSRLVKEKDLSDLVEMDRILRARGSTHRLALVGDGPMRRELEAALPDACFAGHQTGDALARWYASADVFVFPSTTETFGNVVLEAQASGLPTVVVDRGGPAGIVRSGETGWIARSNDPAHLAELTARLLDDAAERTRMGACAREAARSYDWDSINGRLIESYRDVIHENARRPPPE